MNVEKALIKVSAVNDVGVRLDDALEAARADVHRTEGGAQAMERAAELLATCNKLVDKDLEEQKLPDLASATLIKKWLERAASSLKDLRQQYQHARVQAQGRAAGFESAVAIAKRFVDEEQRKVDAFKQAVSEGRVVEEGAYARPPPSIKAQRTAAPVDPPVSSAPKKKKGKSDGKNTR